MDDQDLLRLYVESRSHDAFAQLVGRHVDLVYSSALRQVRDRQLAEDVTQVVFGVLATKAASLRSETVLAGWLLGVTRLECRDILKRDQRRQRRERKAAEMQTQISRNLDKTEWGQIRSLLDEAMEQVHFGDRQAIILRYFQRKSDRETAAILGISENAVRQRVFRALRTMREFLARHDLAVSVAGLSSAMAARAVEAAPAELAAAAATEAVATAAATGAISGGLGWKGAAIMSFMKGKPGVLGIVLALAVGGAAVILTQANSAPPAQAQNARADWLERFEQVYRLDEGEVIRRVAPPFIPERERWLHETMRFTEDHPESTDRWIIGLRWDGSLSFGSLSGGQPGSVGYIATLCLTGVDRRGHIERIEELVRVESPEDILGRDFSGDWIIRSGTTAEQRAAALEELLQEEFGRDLRIERRTVQREAIVVKGEFVFQPIPGLEQDVLYLYTDNLTPELHGQLHTINFAEFLRQVEVHAGHYVVDELDQAPQRVRYQTDQSVLLAKPRRDEANLILLLENLAAQTGLQFDREQRLIEIWMIYDATPAG